MNASKILQQLMQQAGGQKAGGIDVQGMLDGLSRQMGGGRTGGQSGNQSGRQSSGSSGIDLKSLLGGGVIGLLVGSRRGRKLGGKALKYGAIAGVGLLAWKAWQASQRGNGAPVGPADVDRFEVLEGPIQERRSLGLLQAMIMAARADGHIDEQERSLITQQIDALGADAELHGWIEQQLQAPLDASALARQADSPQAAREMYLISMAVVDEQNPMERAWLDQLGKSLALPPELVGELERQARQAVGDQAA
jgi:uncharacterized membrane protein YebE (DUF533 family)